MARSVRPSFYPSPARPLDDDAQTQFMSRSLIPPSGPRSSPGPRAPVYAEERTLCEVPRPAVSTDADERTIVAPLVFPKAATRLVSSPPDSLRATLLPSPGPARSSRLPTLVPPPPPSTSRLFEGPSITPIPAPAPSEHPSSPALVRDVTPSSPPPAPTRRREPLVLAAAALGVLGIIFTMGILVGLVVSLRPGGGSSDASAAASRVAWVPASKAVIAKVVVGDGPADTLAVANAPSPLTVPSEAAPPPRVTHVVHASPAAAAAPPKVTASVAKHPRPVSTDADFEAANAASDLAKAQLDASLR